MTTEKQKHQKHSDLIDTKFTDRCKKLSKEIGPLRYQMSESDCVPITIINALLVVRKKLLKPKLLHLIWTVSLDYDTEGTGWVYSQLLAHALQSWFDRALTDKYEARKPKLKSEIIEGNDVHLNKDNRIACCLDLGGVACLTTYADDGVGHYSLLLAQEGNDYLGFDPWWDKSYSSPKHLEEFGNYHGMVNIRWTRDELLSGLNNKGKNNRWVHLIFPSEQ